MPDIVTLTVNPAVDIATSVARMTDTHKMRCARARCDPGGGGINVARVVHRMGGDCLALYLAGGPMAERLGRLLTAEGLPFEALRIEGETRLRRRNGVGAEPGHRREAGVSVRHSRCRRCFAPCRHRTW